MIISSLSQPNLHMGSASLFPCSDASTQKNYAGTAEITLAKVAHKLQTL